MRSPPFRLAWYRQVIVSVWAVLTVWLSAAPVPAESYLWRNIAIHGGGFVTGLLYHPVEPNLLYARTDVGGVFRWESTQRRWIPLNDGIGRDSVDLMGVVSIAVDAGDSQRLYLAAGSYVQKWGTPAALLWSGDRGVNWHRVALPFKLGGNADGRSTGERLQVDPRDGRILFLGTNQDGLWRSRDRGLSWQRVTSFPQSALTLVLFAPDKDNATGPGKIIYAAAVDLTGPALYRSTDAGDTWAPISGQPTGLLVHHAAFGDDGSLYLTYANGLGPNGVTDGAVWRYSPANSSWTNITPLPPQPSGADAFGYGGLAIDRQHPGTLLVSTLDRWKQQDEIFRSTDSGATWKPLLAASTWDNSSAPYIRRLKPHWIGQLALNPFNGAEAWFITGYGLWATNLANAIDTDASTPWTFTNDGLEETVVDGLISPSEGAPLLSAIGDFAGFRHDDFTKSPPLGAHEPMHGGNPSIAFAERVPAKMARTHSGPARGALSVDGGRTWRDFPSAPSAAASRGPGKIALSADGRRLVWLPKDSVPYFSTDDGVTWSPSRGGPVSPIGYQTIGPVADRTNPQNFYIYNQVTGDLFTSRDGGESYRHVQSLAADGGGLVSEPGRDGGIWLPMPDGLYFSANSGKSFRRLPRVQEAYQLGFGRAAPGRTNPALYLAGRIGGHDGLFRSDDSGRSWVVINDPSHRFGWLRVITGDPRIYGRVYLGTSGRGIIYGEPAPR